MTASPPSVWDALHTMMTQDSPSTFFVETPWRAWGTVHGSSEDEVRRRAEEDRAHTIAELEQRIAAIRNMTYQVQSEPSES